MKPFPAGPRAALACALLTLAPTAPLAQEASPAAEPAAPPVAATPSAPERAAASSEALVVREPVAATKPVFALGNDSYFVSPILALAGGVAAESLLLSPNPNRESRATTMAITRFGFEGRLGPWVTFRSEFERNIRAHGSGIWEGTASMSVRDQVVRLQRWGASVEVGIVLDPASVDFVSAHVGDLLMADRYTRDPLLYSGFNRGQGVQLRYAFLPGLTAGLGYTEANPLSSSASFMVGGTFAGSTRFWERPLGNFRIGQPDDDFHFRVVSPSLSYEHPLFDVKAMAQLFDVNYQASQRVDPRLGGFNVRANARLKLEGKAPFPFKVQPFVNFARVENQVLNNTSGYADTLLQTHFSAVSVSGGVDLLLLGRSGVGVSYAQVRDRSPSFVPPSGTAPASERINRTVQSYLNVGGTLWVTEHVALGARVARFARDLDGTPYEADLSYMLTLRMAL
ncbi:MAG: hypothetical protein L0Y66_06795 [Myxococcaceae bacterium]|nr:hypothetical protein [Myxococcaceae bacterium]MCI0669560.1 hypothetical protein [Myxococcaceae bacterium]